MKQNIILKVIALITTVYSMNSIPTSHAEGRAGNGGDGVVINNRLYLLDLVESNVHLSPYFNSAIAPNPALTNGLRESFSNIPNLNLDKLNSKLEEIATKVDPALGRALYMAITSFHWSLSSSGIVDIPDEDSVLQFPQGQLQQMAIRRDSRIYLSDNSWRLASEEQKIALIIHEAMYALAPINAVTNQQNSSQARTIVGQLFQDRYDARYIRRLAISYGFPTGSLAQLRPRFLLPEHSTALESNEAVVFISSDERDYYDKTALARHLSRGLHCNAFVRNLGRYTNDIPIIFGQHIPYGAFYHRDHLNESYYPLLGFPTNIRPKFMYFRLSQQGYRLQMESLPISLSDSYHGSLVERPDPFIAFPIGYRTLPHYFGTINEYYTCQWRPHYYDSGYHLSQRQAWRTFCQTCFNLFNNQWQNSGSAFESYCAHYHCYETPNTPLRIITPSNMSEMYLERNSANQCLPVPSEWTEGAYAKCQNLINDTVQFGGLFRFMIDHFRTNNITFLNNLL